MNYWLKWRKKRNSKAHEKCNHFSICSIFNVVPLWLIEKYLNVFIKINCKKRLWIRFSAERRIENSIDGEYIYEYTGCGPLKFPKLDTASHLPKEVRKLIWYVNLNAGDVQKKKRIYHNQIGEYTCNGFIKDDFNYSVIIEKVEQ